MAKSYRLRHSSFKGSFNSQPNKHWLIKEFKVPKQLIFYFRLCVNCDFWQYKMVLVCKDVNHFPVGDCSLRRSYGIGDSCLLSVRTLYRSVEEIEVQTDRNLLDYRESHFFCHLEIFGEVNINKLRVETGQDRVTFCWWKKVFFFIEQWKVRFNVFFSDPAKKEQNSQAISQQKSIYTIDTNIKHRQIANVSPPNPLDATKWSRTGKNYRIVCPKLWPL